MNAILPPTRGAQWMTFPLTAFLATLLKNTRTGGAAVDSASGH
jgi:hypothetical protein